MQAAWGGGRAPPWQASFQKPRALVHGNSGPHGFEPQGHLLPRALLSTEQREAPALTLGGLRSARPGRKTTRLYGERHTKVLDSEPQRGEERSDYSFHRARRIRYLEPLSRP